MRDRKELFAALGRSRFRSRFVLGPEDAAYIRSHGMVRIAAHAREFVTRRLAAAKPANDGRQTPMKGHPVFVAQHAAAVCCRGCLAKWHRIEKGRQLTETEVEYVVGVICAWLGQQMAAASEPKDVETISDRTLFE
jgi:hypothetical protein